jgi:hypothetical protein
VIPRRSGGSAFDAAVRAMTSDPSTRDLITHRNSRDSASSVENSQSDPPRMRIATPSPSA